MVWIKRASYATSWLQPADMLCTLVETYSGPFKEHTPPNLHRVSTEYAGPYGSGTKLNELDQAAGVHEQGTPQLNPIGSESTSRTSSGHYHGALSRGHPPRHS